MLGACQTISRLWETVYRGQPQHSHLLFINDPIYQDLVFELRSKRWWRLVNINITNPTSVEVDCPMLWTGRTCLAYCDFIFSNAWNPSKIADLDFICEVSNDRSIDFKRLRKWGHGISRHFHLLFLVSGSCFAGRPWELPSRRWWRLTWILALPMWRRMSTKS